MDAETRDIAWRRTDGFGCRCRRRLFRRSRIATGWDRQLLSRYADSGRRSEEHTSELQSLMRISYAVFCLKKKKYLILFIHFFLNSRSLSTLYSIYYTYNYLIMFCNSIFFFFLFLIDSFLLF